MELSIGRLAKMTGLTPDTLRYYDEIGLLKPAFTSSETGYRYYTAQQVNDIAAILELKAYDFPLAAIKKIIAQQDRVDAPAMTAIFRQRYAELMQEKERISGAMEKLAQKLKIDEEVSLMSKRILLVDDAAFLRMMCRDIMQKNGFVIVGEAENGEVAVEKYKELAPDLVLLNVTMPLMDGIAALRKIREYDPKARVVMLTAMGQSAIVAEALLAGARRFVVKPFQAETLVDKARFVLAEENPPAEPFNKELLTKWLNLARTENSGVPGGEVLSQLQIDDVIRVAETNPQNIDEEALMERLLILYSDPATHPQPPSTPAAAPSQDEMDAAYTKHYRELASFEEKTYHALDILLRGQEKMLALLEKIANK